MSYQLRWEPVVIPSGAAVPVAGVSLLPGERVVGVETPAEWTAADICLQMSRDGGTTFVDVMGLTGTILRLTTIATAAAELRLLGEALSALSTPLGPQMIRPRSVNTASAADVNQGAARTLYLYISKDN